MEPATTSYYIPAVMKWWNKGEQPAMADDESALFCYKIIILGDSGTGKTALLTRFTDDWFTPKFAPTIGVDFKIKTVDVDGKMMKLQFWDTAGQERFRAVVTSYHRSVNGVLLVYDITNRQSFNSVANWKNVVEEYNPKDDFAVAIIANKCELTDRRDVTEKEGRQLADDHGAIFFETSAKDAINVREAFVSVARAIKEHCTGNQSSQALLSRQTKCDAQNQLTVNGADGENSNSKTKQISKKPCCS